MEIDLATGLLIGIDYLPSPHCNDRPLGAVIDLLVIHGISLPPGEFGNGAIKKFFCGELDCTLHSYFDIIKKLKVSAHLLISRRGEITQFVPFTKRAWHAGESHFNGQSNCNDFSIGIELEGTDDIPYDPIQYQCLAALIDVLMSAYPTLTRERIVGHVDIAPGRKTDPGPAFDWSYLDCLLAIGSS